MAHRIGAMLGVAIFALGVAGVTTTLMSCKYSITESCTMLDHSPNSSGISDLQIVQYSDDILQANTFVRLDNVTKLEIFHGSMKVIEPGAFAKMPKLQVIKIMRNKLNALEANTFAGLNNLETLSLDFNKLTSISPDAFAGLQNLQFLVLTGNSLSQLPEALFQPTPRLKTIDLSNNMLPNLPAGLFDPLSYLWRLDLSFNQLQSFQFPRLNVMLLQLQNNSLTEIDLNDHVVYLRAQHNQISTVTGTGANLTSLILSDNAITDVAPLFNIKNLSRLALNDNPLNPTSVFIGFEALVYLTLSNTNIQITEQTFANLSHLLLLDLSSNGLTQLDFHMFSTLTELEVLIMTDNRIEKINFTEVRENLPRLRVLQICGNGWNSTYLKTALNHMLRNRLSVDLHELSISPSFHISSRIIQLCSTSSNILEASSKDDNLNEEDYYDKDYQEIYPTTPEPSTIEKILRTTPSTSNKNDK